jgi:glycosyltransferase involved in cell wall biosynthesis
MTTPSHTHLVLIPSYNTGPRLASTVREARQFWAPVWIVVDGSTDGSEVPVLQMATQDPQIKVLVLPQNQGKGAAVLHGLAAAHAAGFTHALTMDSDGQHPSVQIPEFMATSLSHPSALVLGKPVFDASAPFERVAGRKLSNGAAHLETLWAGIGDSLYGMRVYPIIPLREVMEASPWMRRFDFDPEVAVRLCWKGLTPINIDSPVKYFKAAEGGVSHYHYVRDNILITGMHARLLAGFLLRLPMLLWRRMAAESARSA